MFFSFDQEEWVINLTMKDGFMCWLCLGLIEDQAKDFKKQGYHKTHI